MRRIPRLLVSNASYRAASPVLPERYGMTSVSSSVTPDVIAVSRALATAKKTGATTGRKRGCSSMK
jgi:hypothetical protein